MLLFICIASYFNVCSKLQQFTLYDRKTKKTIVIIMRDFKIIPYLIGKLYKDRVKLLKRINMCLTKTGVKGTITHERNTI